MIRIMGAARSGLLSHQVKMDVIGNNIANINTVGYKGSRVNIEESFAQLLSGAFRPPGDGGGINPMQVGLGSSVGSIDTILTQGSLDPTGQITDLAIQGRDYFVVRAGNEQLYTRNGSFQFDAQGRMISPTNGGILQGLTAAEDGTFPPGTTTGDIIIPFGQKTPANATTDVQYSSNLNSDADARGTKLHSQRFLALMVGDEFTATGDTLTSLFDSVGVSLGIRLGDRMTISGQITDAAGNIVENFSNSLLVNNLSGTATNIGELVQLMNTTFAGLSSAAAGLINATINPDGTITVDNSAIAPNLSLANFTVSTDNTLNQSSVQTTFNFDSVIDPGLTATTDRFFSPADSNDLLRSLFDEAGRSVGYEAGDTLTINGAMGGISVTPGTLSPRISNGISLATVAASNIVTDASANFTTAGVIDGDVIKLTDGNADDGYYFVQVVNATTLNLFSDAALTVAAPLTITAANVDYSIAPDFSLQDLLNETRNTLNLPPTVRDKEQFSQSLEVNAADTQDTDIFPDGSIVIRGLPGVDFALTNVSFTVDNGNNKNPGPSFFTANLSLTEVQSARDFGQHSTSITIYDSAGSAHDLTLTFTHSGEEDHWIWEASMSKDEVRISGFTGDLFFNQDGSPSAFIYDGGVSFFSVDPNNGADILQISLDAGTVGSFKGITQFESPFTTKAKFQDGFAMGVLDSISINELGMVQGAFTNGIQKNLAQIQLASFVNPGGLIKTGDNMLSKSDNAGEAVLVEPGVSTSSTIRPGALEMANVDLAQEFTSMIITQRGFQANARSITTADEMLQELVALKR